MRSRDWPGFYLEPGNGKPPVVWKWLKARVTAHGKGL